MSAYQTAPSASRRCRPGGRLAQPCQRYPHTSWLEVCAMTRVTCASCPETRHIERHDLPRVAATGEGGAGGVSAAERARSGHGLDEAWTMPGAGPQACRGRRLGVVGRLLSFPFEGRDALCVRLIGASCQPWSAPSPCVATDQAEIAAEGGADRRSARRRGRAVESIARSAPLGLAAPLPRGGIRGVSRWATCRTGGRARLAPSLPWDR
jgi:hypothetical protein